VQTGGPAVTLAGANTSQPAFTPTVPGTYAFTLTVNDGAAAASSSVQIIVDQPNRAPVANNDAFTTNTTLNVSAPGVLGNDSDADGNSLTAVLQTPPAQGTLTLNANGSFTYVPPTSFSGQVIFTYRANDGQAANNLSNVATVTINVTSNNVAPIANAGANRVVYLGRRITLNGTRSRDPDNGPAPLAYVWVQTGGPTTVLLANPNTARPSLIPKIAGIYRFTLTVSDGVATSSPSTVTIRARLRDARDEDDRDDDDDRGERRR
jgi:hypothetical protein